MNNNLTAQRVMEVLDYNPDTGIFTRKVKARGVKERVAGTLAANGYVRVKFGEVPYMAHRLAWLYVYGSWPNVRNDNRILNLREASHAENTRNSAKPLRNKTGYKGAYRTRKTFRSQIVVNKKQINLGRFNSPEEAHAAYCAAANMYHGEFARFE